MLWPNCEKMDLKHRLALKVKWMQMMVKLRRLDLVSASTALQRLLKKFQQIFEPFD